jgi:thiamine-phosphate pyrophosphorylase
MRYEFTPATERALAAAAAWTSSDDVDELHVPEALLGLMAEPECRAALLLAKCDVYPGVVHRKFPALALLDPPRPQRAHRFSRQLQVCFDKAESLLADYPRPLFLATEHLLLGIVATPSEVSQWLEECGMTAEALEIEVHRLAGHESGPLPLEDSSSLDDDSPPPLEIDDLPGARPLGAERSQQEKTVTLRIIDAAANRAGEGLRVIEDYLRFALDDAHLTLLAKAIRHDLTSALDFIAPANRHAARETQADVGTVLSLPAEQVRRGPGDVVAASFKRVEQSLRSLEEFVKTLAPKPAAVLKELRYRVYTLERAVQITRTSLERLAEARLCVLIDAGPSAEALRRLVESLLSVGVPMIQLRDKQLNDRQLLARARLTREMTRAGAALFIMNDRPDLAVLSGADGVHLGQGDVSVKDARRILGPDGLVGVSTHSLDQARQAVLDGANYIGVGPTFPSGTKSFSEFTGPELLRAVSAEIRLPAIAIGGITAENLSQVLAAGFTRAAVQGAVAGASNPAAAAAALLKALVR